MAARLLAPRLCRPLALARRRSSRPLAAAVSLCASNRRGVAAAAATHEAPATEASQGNKGGRNTDAPGFQAAIQRLQEFWASKGCIIWQPHNTEVGAGTMNPATFLRVLGPEPWSVCYVEPSVRPDDSRYGENPNRMQRHTQLQVILKPQPGTPQELYLESLRCLGVDTARNDVRFVEDNWESPALGAWGLGWEVWLNGLEVTQFTYFQQAGAQPLDVPAVEITYGLERILMALQRVQHFRDIDYARGVSYGELFLQQEVEFSRYNMQEAAVEDLQARFALFEAEAEQLLDKRLPLPAYDHILKLSHTFNVLDARGAISLSERQANFARMRALSRRVSELYLERRAELEHPLGLVPAFAGPEDAPPCQTPPPAPPPESAAPFLLELGTEELPPGEVATALAELEARVGALLAEHRLAYERLAVFGTPRRLAVCVAGLAARQSGVEESKRGPPRARAYDDAGAPTKALTGFCRSCGADLSSVRFEADKKGVEYCYVMVRDDGGAAAGVLATHLPALLASLPFAKTMRWRPYDDFAFPRPLRWLVAMHGGAVVPLRFGGLAASQASRAARGSDLDRSQQYIVHDTAPDPEHYEAALAAERAGAIIVDPVARRERIWADVSAAAEARPGRGGTVPEAATSELLDEVTHLVEAPTVVVGAFDEEFLELPEAVLVMVMRKHQRYFPVYTPGGALRAAFVTVADGAIDADLVRAGNEDVLRARFRDAAFFYAADLKTPLAEWAGKLRGTLFHRALGSMHDKVMRTAAIVHDAAAALGLADAAHDAERATMLGKADLATNMVTEMTALAGVMGKHYALAEGQPQAVADAIFESVLPRTADDELPHTPAGIVASVCDRVDSLMALAAAGCLPSASADPFGMRRTTVGLLQTLLGNEQRVSLRRLLELARAQQSIECGADVLAAVEDFAAKRLEQLLLDRGLQAEAVRAVLAERADDPALAAASAAELDAALRSSDAADALPRVQRALSRPTRLIRGKEVTEVPVDTALFEREEERALLAAYERVRLEVAPGMGVGEWLAATSAIVEPVDAFFDGVMVMAEDAAVRVNRLALVRDVSTLPHGVLDLSELPGF